MHGSAPKPSGQVMVSQANKGDFVEQDHKELSYLPCVQEKCYNLLHKLEQQRFHSGYFFSQIMTLFLYAVTRENVSC